MLGLIFTLAFTVLLGYTIYLFIPKSTDMPGESILSLEAQQAIKELMLKPIDWLSFQMDTKDKKCLEILEENPNHFILKRIGFMLAFGLVLFMVAGPWMIAVGLIVGWIFPSMSLRARYNNWRDSVSADSPTMVDYLIIYFSIGYNVPMALNEASEVVGPDLSQELRRVSADIALNKDYASALDKFSERVDNPHVDAILQQLKASWSTKASPDMFEDLADSLVEMRKLKISMATSRQKIFMVALPILGVLGLLTLVCIPLAYTVMGQFTDITITSN